MKAQRQHIVFTDTGLNEEEKSEFKISLCLERQKEEAERKDTSGLTG